jgi:hypothetical protein
MMYAARAISRRLDFDALLKKINDFWIEKVTLPRRALAA